MEFSIVQWMDEGQMKPDASTKHKDSNYFTSGPSTLHVSTYLCEPKPSYCTPHPSAIVFIICSVSMAWSSLKLI